MTTKILAMDTSGLQGTAALLEDAQVVRQSAFQEKRGHLVPLTQTVVRMFNETNWQIKDLNLIVVTTGPGSFSGVRIALGLAKGMVLAQGTPVVGISTLEVAAAAVGGVTVSWSVPILDARRGEVFSALYRLTAKGNIRQKWPPSAWSPENLAHALADDPDIDTIVLNGSGLVSYKDVFQNILGGKCQVAPTELWPLDPVVLGNLGLERFKEGNLSAIDLIVPLYLRRSEAEVKKMATCTSRP